MKYNYKINQDYLNIIQCEGTACVSVGKNIRRYYADNMIHRTLKPKVYKYERN